ncbi:PLASMODESMATA CALLOSE-BINDING PROTEIN 3 [Linum grandiflorum]
MATSRTMFLFGMLMLAMTGQAMCTWCVCKDMGDAVLQKTLDYACGAGADCNPTRPNGPCFQPNTVRAHCSYAVNSYFQKKGQSPAACDFSATAAISTSDPSVNGCSFPASASASNTGGTQTPVSNNPSKNPGVGTGTGTTTVPNINSPTPTSNTNTNNPYNSNGSIGNTGTGTGTGLGASGPDAITDMSDAVTIPVLSSSLTLFIVAAITTFTFSPAFAT